jgi:hypothetical protein
LRSNASGLFRNRIRHARNLFEGSGDPRRIFRSIPVPSMKPKSADTRSSGDKGYPELALICFGAASLIM